MIRSHSHAKALAIRSANRPRRGQCSIGRQAKAPAPPFGAAVLLAILALIASHAAAQETRGQILGRITDATGSVVSGAKVTGKNAATNVANTAVTNSTGDYALPFLIPGIYGITVEMAGFHGFKQDNIVVQIDATITLNVKLEVGATSQTVEVTSESPLVDATDASTGLVVDSKSMEELPIKDGNPVMLAMLTPGVANLQTTGSLSLPFDNANSSLISVSGARTGQNEYMIDGAPNTNGQGGSVAFAPPAGAVSEFKIQTATFDARNGFAIGGNVNITLKSGTNRIHGETYAFLENPALNANSFFSNAANLGKDNYREARFSGSVNGPVVIPHVYNGHNRTFWMYTYEHINANVPHDSTGLVYSVPTTPERTGDFSALLALGSQYQIYDPDSTKPSTTSGRYQRTPFTNNIIPASRLDKNAQAMIADYFPPANIAGSAGGVNNFDVRSLEVNTFWTQVFRVDHVINEKHRIFVRGDANDRFQTVDYRFNNSSGFNGPRDNYGFGIDYVWVIGPQFLFETRYNYTRYTDLIGPPTAGMDATTLGFSQTLVNETKSIDARTLALPNLNIIGYAELNGQPITQNYNAIHAGAFDFTRMAAAHTMHFGGEMRVYLDTYWTSGNANGLETFDTTYTKGPLDNAAASPMGQGLAAFLLGQPTGGQIDVNSSYADKSSVGGLYFQDAWKATSKLTVNLGLRWELESPTTERYNRTLRGFDPTATVSVGAVAEANYKLSPSALLPPAAFIVQGGLSYAGVNGLPRGMWNTTYKNFAPRAAIAYQLDSKTVIRSGYGIFYDLDRRSALQTGFSRSTTLTASNDTGQTYIASMENPFPSGLLVPTGSSLGADTNVGSSFTIYPSRLLNPYAQRWQFGIQRSLGGNSILEIAYVGNRSVHLINTGRNIDGLPDRYLSSSPVRDNANYSLLTANVKNPFYPLLPSTSLSGSTVSTSQILLPFPQFTSVTVYNNDGASWYHALQARYQKRFSHGYTLLANYTWSKYMQAISYANAGDPSPTASISDQDRPHRIVTTVIYELPFGAGKLWGSAWPAVPKMVLGGWQLQGIYQWQVGAPLSFGNDLYYGYLHDIALPADKRSIQEWFNTSLFETNTARQLVDNLRTFPLYLAGVRAPGLSVADLGLSKKVNLREHMTLQIRGEAFNALNTPQFAAPNTTVTSTAFGTITAASQLPRTVEVSARIQF